MSISRIYRGHISGKPAVLIVTGDNATLKLDDRAAGVFASAHAAEPALLNAKRERPATIAILNTGKAAPSQAAPTKIDDLTPR